MNLAPILLFVYNRLDTLRLTVDSLKKNIHSNESELFIFSDGYKNDQDKILVEEVRQYIKGITGFKRIVIYSEMTNIGLANSIIKGVCKILEDRESVIILEDDLYLSNNFLAFMNQSLEYYKNNQNILSVSGYTPPIHEKVKNIDVYFSRRSSSWGWATWRERWFSVNWNPENYRIILNNKRHSRLLIDNGSDLYKMLKRRLDGKINSWAILFVAHQYLYKLYSVHPLKSKVINIGISHTLATHTRHKYDRFKTELDCSNLFEFSLIQNIYYKKSIDKDAKYPYSLFARFLNRILNFLL